MTDKEIVQALRCCAEGECKDCAMHEDKQRCQENLLDKAAEAIERLTAENAALEKQLGAASKESVHKKLEVNEKGVINMMQEGKARFIPE